MDRRDHLRIIGSDWPDREERQAPPAPRGYGIESLDRYPPSTDFQRGRRPSIGRILLELLAWISESEWRTAAMIGTALLAGLLAALILP